MAGFYPDVPGHRFAYHLDGTEVYVLNSDNTLNQLSAGQVASINDEDGDGFGPFGVALIVLFPQLRDISGYFLNAQPGTNAGTLQCSADTTTLLDGTWSTVVNPWVMSTGLQPNYRSSVNTVTAGSIKALKFNWGISYNNNMGALHIYGDIPAAQSPDRLVFWDPTNDVEAAGAYFDWGDVVQGSTATKTFRIKNNSASLTANSITISSAVETYTMAINFSTDGTTFTPTINIGNLAPGAISPVLTVQRPVSAGESLELQASHFKASASSWS